MASLQGPFGNDMSAQKGPAPANPFMTTAPQPKLGGNPFANANTGSRAAMPGQAGFSLGGMGSG